MSKTIKIDELSETVMDYLENYREDIQEDVEEVTDIVTRKAKDELRQISPRRKGSRSNPYYKGWSVKIQKRGKLKYHKVIWNKTNYQLTHLLEFGHATRNGGRTKAIPHIQPVEQKYNVEFVDLLEQRIRRRSK